MIILRIFVDNQAYMFRRLHIFLLDYICFGQVFVLSLPLQKALCRRRSAIQRLKSGELFGKGPLGAGGTPRYLREPMASNLARPWQFAGHREEPRNHSSALLVTRARTSLFGARPRAPRTPRPGSPAAALRNFYLAHGRASTGINMVDWRLAAQSADRFLQSEVGFPM